VVIAPLDRSRASATRRPIHASRISAAGRALTFVFRPGADWLVFVKIARLAVGQCAELCFDLPSTRFDLLLEKWKCLNRGLPAFELFDQLDNVGALKIRLSYRMCKLISDISNNI
jgi:hypothetical protein